MLSEKTDVKAMSETEVISQVRFSESTTDSCVNHESLDENDVSRYDFVPLKIDYVSLRV